jgi:hypothetical protein
VSYVIHANTDLAERRIVALRFAAGGDPPHRGRAVRPLHGWQGPGPVPNAPEGLPKTRPQGLAVRPPVGQRTSTTAPATRSM